MKESKKKLNRSDITRLGYRSLINQAGFNYERMQNIGFTATIGPALEKIYKNEQKTEKNGRIPENMKEAFERMRKSMLTKTCQ